MIHPYRDAAPRLFPSYHQIVVATEKTLNLYANIYWHSALLCTPLLIATAWALKPQTITEIPMAIYEADKLLGLPNFLLWGAVSSAVKVMMLMAKMRCSCWGRFGFLVKEKQIYFSSWREEFFTKFVH